MSAGFAKILVANRGEIACRVIRTARRLGIRSVAVYSDADATALHVENADEAFRIGPASAAESYLDARAIIDAARRSRADAIHPGYGFLAENAEFAEICEAAGVRFIGPPPEAIRVMGAKNAALAIMHENGVPVLPGYHDEAQDDASLVEAAKTIGFPLLVKPVAGGGGKGMRVVRGARELGAALASARREARSAFGDDALLLERYLERPRHVEVQVFADDHGNVVHLHERDCSIQRRHQKIVEEAPAPDLDEDTRTRMGEVAVKATRAIGYRGAGTIEFLYDASGDGGFYFMEMNTRLQVEHPVTEMILGQDLVEWQIRVAQGEPLPMSQGELLPAGHAIEVRIYAEDPAREFLPAAGKLVRFTLPPAEERLRVDTGVREGDEVGIHYDPMIAKLIVHGRGRAGAVRRLERALEGCRVVGVPTNLGLLRHVAVHPAFAAGRVHTGFVVEHAPELMPARSSEGDATLAAACLYLFMTEDAARASQGRRSRDPYSPWHTQSGWRLNEPGREEIVLARNGEELRVAARRHEGGFSLALPGGEVEVKGGILEDGELWVELEGRRFPASVVRHQTVLEVFAAGDHARLGVEERDLTGAQQEATPGKLTAPMPGKVIAIVVEAGQQVERGEAVMVIEAMKMEHTITAPHRGVVERIAFAEGELVAEGAELLVIEPAGES